MYNKKIIFVIRKEDFTIIRRKNTKKFAKPRDIYNEWIYFLKVQVIDENGKFLGIMNGNDAKNLAYSRGLDILCVNVNAKPPVCKILDYGKYKYLQKKQNKDHNKSTHILEKVKEIRLTLTIQKGDLEIKKQHAIKFLESNHRVIVSLRFFGAQRNFIEQGKVVFNSFVKDLKEYSVVEHETALKGHVLQATLKPNLNKKNEKQDKN